MGRPPLPVIFHQPCPACEQETAWLLWPHGQRRCGTCQTTGPAPDTAAVAAA